ncbi:MAG TPA: EAL domain-containing protein, partial [Rhodanobacter sp.]|nr:EAL domain-containing protein [Rhodanobacter sp.]
MHGANNPVVFGYFTAALLATAAVAFAAGIQFLLVGVRQKSDRTPLAFALLCLCAAVLAAARAGVYVSSTLSGATLALRVVAGSALVAFPLLMSFVAHYTSRRIPRGVFAAAVVLAGVLFWINLWTPFTVLDDALHVGPRLQLPWGESLYGIEGARSFTGHVFYGFSYAVFGWAMYAAMRQFHAGQRLRAALLLVCLTLQLLAVVWAAVSVDTLGMPYPAADAFAFLSFVLLMSLSLVGQMHTHTVQLERASEELRHEATTRVEAELELHHAAWHDALTDLPNRPRLQQLLRESIAGAERDGHYGALLILDLDNFKTINDSLGHLMGDRVLQAITDRLLATVPENATVARFGGDEFVVLLDNHADHAARAAAGGMQIAQSLLDGLAPPLTIDRRLLPVSASVGVATFPDAGTRPEDILRRADIALYRAKAAGRHAIRQFQPQMQHDADMRLELERGLRIAVERGELAVHFQPQVDMHGHLVGAEALLRWHHPELGEIAPATFIPIAEETGLIHAIGTWAIATTCGHLREWRRRDVAFGAKLSVNVSPWQLASARFPAELLAQVRAAGVPPDALTLELTESALLTDFDAARHALDTLSAAGFRLSLDDFGTGYSSLAYLRQLPLD